MDQRKRTQDGPPMRVALRTSAGGGIEEYLTGRHFTRKIRSLRTYLGGRHLLLFLGNGSADDNISTASRVVMVDKPSLCSSTYFLFCSSSNAAVPLLQMLTPSQQEGQDYEEGWFDNLFGDVEARLLTAPDRDPTGVCIMQDKIPASSEADEALRAWVRTPLSFRCTVWTRTDPSAVETRRQRDKHWSSNVVVFLHITVSRIPSSIQGTGHHGWKQCHWRRRGVCFPTSSI